MPDADDAMIEPWTRLEFIVRQVDFGSNILEAQKHCFILRQVRVVASEKFYCNRCERGHCRATLLVPSNLMKTWEANATDAREVKERAVRQLCAHAEGVLSRAGKLIPF